MSPIPMTASASVQRLLSHFVPYIAFHRIPTAVLMNEIRPLGVVPDAVLMHALAYQADPCAVIGHRHCSQVSGSVVAVLCRS